MFTFDNYRLLPVYGEIIVGPRFWLEFDRRIMTTYLTAFSMEQYQRMQQ